MCAGVGLSGGRGRLLTHVHRASACTLNAVGLLPVSGCGDARVAPLAPPLCVCGEIYLTLPCHVPVAARRCWLQDATRMSRRHRARGTAAAAATDGPAAAPAGRTRGAAPTPAPISPSADVPDWVGPPGSSVADTRDSPAMISNRELEASLCRAKCFRCDKCNCPGARDPAGKGDGCTGFSRERGDLAWLRGDHADARQPSAAQLAVLRRPAVSLVVAGKIEKISRGRRATAQQCTPCPLRDGEASHRRHQRARQWMAHRTAMGGTNMSGCRP